MTRRHYKPGPQERHDEAAYWGGEVQRFEDATAEQRRDWVDEDGEPMTTRLGQHLVKAQLAIEAAKDYQESLMKPECAERASTLRLLGAKLVAASCAIDAALEFHNDWRVK